MSGYIPPPICALLQLLNEYSDSFYVFPDTDFNFWQYSMKLLIKEIQVEFVCMRGHCLVL